MKGIIALIFIILTLIACDGKHDEISEDMNLIDFSALENQIDVDKDMMRNPGEYIQLDVEVHNHLLIESIYNYHPDLEAELFNHNTLRRRIPGSIIVGVFALEYFDGENWRTLERVMPEPDPEQTRFPVDLLMFIDSSRIIRLEHSLEEYILPEYTLFRLTRRISIPQDQEFLRYEAYVEFELP